MCGCAGSNRGVQSIRRIPLWGAHSNTTVERWAARSNVETLGHYAYADVYLIRFDSSRNEFCRPTNCCNDLSSPSIESLSVPNAVFADSRCRHRSSRSDWFYGRERCDTGVRHSYLLHSLRETLIICGEPSLCLGELGLLIERAFIDQATT